MLVWGSKNLATCWILKNFNLQPVTLNSENKTLKRWIAWDYNYVGIPQIQQCTKRIIPNGYKREWAQTHNAGNCTWIFVHLFHFFQHNLTLTVEKKQKPVYNTLRNEDTSPMGNAVNNTESNLMTVPLPLHLSASRCITSWLWHLTCPRVLISCSEESTVNRMGAEACPLQCSASLTPSFSYLYSDIVAWV